MMSLKLVVTEQSQPPLAAGVHATFTESAFDEALHVLDRELQTYGMEEKVVHIGASPAQSVCVPDTLRHELGSAMCSTPVAVVLSENVPFALAVQVPVTCSEPVTGAESHSKPNDLKSNWPSTLRHDDVTFQVPTKSPPHGVRTGHESGVVVGLPPVAAPPIPLTAPVFAPPAVNAPPVEVSVLTMADEPPVAVVAESPPVAAVPPVSSNTLTFGPQATAGINAAMGRNASAVFNE